MKNAPRSRPPVPPPLVFGYTNHNGKYEVRRVKPETVWFGTTPYYTEPVWLLRAYCLERGANRDFDIAKIVPVLDEWGQPIR